MKQKIELKINGMHCVNCERSIERELGHLDGIHGVKASFRRARASIEFDDTKITLAEIEKVIKELDYEVVPILIGAKTGNWTQTIYILVIIFCIYLILKRLGILRLTNYFPTIHQGMSYGMLFVIGLFTSVHCISMCGGINLTQSINAAKQGTPVLRANALYNLGRVISYTVLGGVVGFAGSIFSFGGGFRGIIAIIAGAFMVIMGLNMLNVFPWLRRLNLSIPKGIQMFLNGKKKGKSSFYIGLINGFIPCGPLQSMQLFALSTGSFASGALSMFLFSIGTVPLMFGFGALAGKLNKKLSSVILSASAVLVIILGVGMLNNGLALSGITIINDVQTSDRKVAIMEDGYQEVRIDIDYGSYEDIVVKKDIPVRFIVHATKQKLNGCNNEILIPEYSINVKLKEGDNVIEFTPTKTGTISYSCWMGMIRSSIQVTD